jgi:hypothetical protein
MQVVQVALAAAVLAVHLGERQGQQTLEAVVGQAGTTVITLAPLVVQEL